MVMCEMSVTKSKAISHSLRKALSIPLYFTFPKIRPAVYIGKTRA